MSIHTWQTRNYLSFIYRLEPIREGFVRWSKIHVLCPLLRRKIGGICFETVFMDDVMVWQTGLLVRSNDRATTQIPIASRLF